MRVSPCGITPVLPLHISALTWSSPPLLPFDQLQAVGLRKRRGICFGWVTIHVRVKSPFTCAVLEPVCTNSAGKCGGRHRWESSYSDTQSRKRRATSVCVCVWSQKGSLGTCSKCAPMCNSIRWKERRVLEDVRPELNVSSVTLTPRVSQTRQTWFTGI